MVLTLEIHVWKVGSRLSYMDYQANSTYSVDHLSHLLTPVIFLL